MEIFLFLEGQKPHCLASIEEVPGEGFVWLDFDRDASPNWASTVARVTGCRVHDAHVADSFNVNHPAFFDSTDDYTMLVFRGLAPKPDIRSFDTRPTALFLLERALVTVRSADSVSIATLKKKLLESTVRIPRRPIGLLHIILSTMIDRFLALRDPLTRQLEDWQRDLLDPNNPFNNWLHLMEQRNRLRKLEVLCEDQLDAVIAWREEVSDQFDEPLTIRFNDLAEHIRRVHTTAQHLQAQIESLVQIHFSAVANRTNEVVRTLTVVSAIFLPLTLVASVFGMNFSVMPGLEHPYGYFGALAFMAALGISLFLVFRKRKWM